MKKFDKTFWEDKYTNEATGWDIGHISTPLKIYFEQLEDKEISVLIPGCGNGYEAEYLHTLGFENVHILDLVSQPLENFGNRVADFPKKHLIHGDFFKHTTKYDLIIEQTFFCALDPQLRSMYAEKMSQLLKSNGKLAGLLFNFPLTAQGPPFGGSLEEYATTFSPLFEVKTLEKSYNSIDDRVGKELFIIFKKI